MYFRNEIGTSKVLDLKENHLRYPNAVILIADMFVRPNKNG